MELQKQKILMGCNTEVTRRNWQRSAALIGQAAMADLPHHIGDQTVYDDITLLVFKQK
jgi:serine phosphatase RsbU (regulator of sigma subunit)